MIVTMNWLTYSLTLSCLFLVTSSQVIRMCDLQGFWFPDYPGISNPDVFTKWMQSAMTQIETNFYSDYPTVTLKIQNTIANSTYLPEIIQQALQGTSPLSSQLAGEVDFLSALVDPTIDGIWIVSGLAHANASVIWLNSYLQALSIYFAGLPPPRENPPFIIGFSGMSPIVNYISQQGRGRGIHGYLLDEYPNIKANSSQYSEIVQIKDLFNKTGPYQVQFNDIVPANSAAKQNIKLAGYATGGQFMLMAEYICNLPFLTVTNRTILMLELQQDPFYADQDALGLFTRYFKPAGPHELPAAILIGQIQFEGTMPLDQWNTWVSTSIEAAATIAEKYNVPVYTNLPIGHLFPSYAWQLGETVMQYSVDSSTLTFLYN